MTDLPNPKDRIGATKPPLALVPPALMLHAAEAMANGAEKYGPYNWRENDVTATTYVSAAMRHLAAWLDGENVAPDSGIDHLSHVAGCLAVLLDARAVGCLIDDRPPPGPAAQLIEAMTRTT